MDAAAVASAPFDGLAGEYDRVFTDSRIGGAQRRLVWRVMDRVFQPGQHVLEINCGTGVDAARLAGRGVSVWACDQSARMVEQARWRMRRVPAAGSAEVHVLAIEALQELQPAERFDGVFSNFSGLNCVEDLRAAAEQLARLLRPAAPALLCVSGRWGGWEMAGLLAQGQLGKGLRRLRHGVVEARIAGAPIRVRYYCAPALARRFAPHFRLLRWRGVGVAVPSSRWEPWARRHPRLLTRMERLDRHFGAWWGYRSLADHLLIELQRT
ncbi:MAG: class I SAM-dependent methyltransferase [Terriglobales bacterium]